jgi:hypothetical protein
MSISDGGRVFKSRTSPLRKKFVIQVSAACQNAYPVLKPLGVALEIRTKDFRELEESGFVSAMPSD